MAKQIMWMGSSLDDLKSFPKPALKEAGRELYRIQPGLDPTDWKPFDGVGPGAREIRMATEGNQYRVFYVVKFGDAIVVLHAFAKKTQKTTRHDIETGKRRYKAALDWRRANEPR